MANIKLPQNKFLKGLVIFFSIPLVFYFLPFIIGGFLIRFVFRKINHKVVKSSIIAGILFPTLLVGTGWAVGLTQGITNPQPSTPGVSVTESPTQVPTPTSVPTPTPRNDLYQVEKVIDGDTISVNINGTSEIIRLIGINAPETNDPRSTVQCLGIEASEKAKQILTGQKVALEADPTQGERDKYGRLLRFVFLEDNTDFSKRMIFEGYAYEYTYNLPYKYQAEYKQAETESRSANRGLWNENACITPTSVPLPTAVPVQRVAYPTKVPAAYIPPPVVTQAPQAVQQPVQSSPVTTNNNPSTNSGADKDCADFSSQAEAQSYFNGKGGSPSNNVDDLDRDHDGVACESLN